MDDTMQLLCVPFSITNFTSLEEHFTVETKIIKGNQVASCIPLPTV